MSWKMKALGIVVSPWGFENFSAYIFLLIAAYLNRRALDADIDGMVPQAKKGKRS